MARRLEITALPGLPEVEPGADLAALIAEGMARARITPVAGDIVAMAQKIVSKAEGRIVALETVTPSARAMELAARARKDARVVELILRESRAVLRCVPDVIVVENRNGFVMANAGIDASNVGRSGHVLLLPVDPDASAAALRRALAAITGADLGVVILDSFGRAWRLGTVGTAIGVAGLPALLDLRQTPDRDGRPLQTSELGLADEVAAAASLIMGQAGEGLPVAHLRGVPYGRTEGRAADLVRARERDLFR